MTDIYKEYLEGVVGSIEATSYEQHMLWCEYAIDGARFGAPKRIRYSWNATGSGYFADVGEIDGRAIYISLMTNTVNDKKLLFWYPSGNVADYDVCEAWLLRHLPEEHFANGFNPYNHTNPMNFSNILR